MTLPFEGSLAYRRRNFWEAADAGLLLWRANFAYFLPFFAVPFWTAAFALRIIPQEARYLSWIVLWLLRPLFDRTVLHVISIRYFDDTAGAGRLLRGLFKNLRCGLAGDLLWRRFSPFRFTMMPLRVLEKPERRKLKERRHILNRGGLGLGGLLPLWGFFLEAILFCGELLFFFIMNRLFKDGLLAAFDVSLINTELWYFVLWCLNFMLVETLCVCMGFGVYLNSRVEVEGWDLEILLRRCREKRGAKNSALALVLLCLGLCMLCPAEGFAEDRAVPLSSANVPEKALESVFASPDFGGKKETWGIRRKNQKEPQASKPLPNYTPPAWIKDILQTAAYILRLLIIIIIAAAAMFLLWYLRRFLPERKFKFKKSKAAMRGLAPAEAESPESLLQKAVRAFEQGELRLTWGFCTAAALRSWPLYRGTGFPPDATEYECLALVRASAASAKAASSQALSAEAEQFSVLIRHWVNFAYGGRLPPEGSFENSLAFCKSLRGANE